MKPEAAFLPRGHAFCISLRVAVAKRFSLLREKGGTNKKLLQLFWQEKKKEEASVDQTSWDLPFIQIGKTCLGYNSRLCTDLFVSYVSGITIQVLTQIHC